ncbi:dUTP diphosphatase [Halobacillus sp. Marseille-Q1614]|uniref:dUTP diphosphatase n=1 Tax=Halobacillus sp. Marseille-Q1614 TaxID=2709134 RepID=UPI001570F85E|nr:dUTP diphosphatase [Halobacillus sp. Marseille-Q1614]
MNWSEFYDMQKQLDSHIMKSQNLQGKNVVDDKILALLVEAGELANETRCFKFWSTKPSSPKEVILEEYVDGLHFILSLGLDLGFYYEKETEETENLKSAAAAFLEVYTSIEEFKQAKSEGSYVNLFQSYLKLGLSLGLKEEDLMRGYIQKNEVNFQRQEEGY